MKKRNGEKDQEVGIGQKERPKVKGGKKCLSRREHKEVNIAGNKLDLAKTGTWWTKTGTSCTKKS